MQVIQSWLLKLHRQSVGVEQLHYSQTGLARCGAATLAMYIESVPNRTSTARPSQTGKLQPPGRSGPRPNADRPQQVAA